MEVPPANGDVHDHGVPIRISRHRALGIGFIEKAADDDFCIMAGRVGGRGNGGRRLLLRGTIRPRRLGDGGRIGWGRRRIDADRLAMKDAHERAVAAGDGGVDVVGGRLAGRFVGHDVRRIGRESDHWRQNAAVQRKECRGRQRDCPALAHFVPRERLAARRRINDPVRFYVIRRCRIQHKHARHGGAV